MIKSTSKRLVKWLLSVGAISQDDRELYEYATYCLLFNLMPIVFTSMVSVPMGMFAEGILMIIPFIIIRNFSGGFHMKSAAFCFISSTVLLATFLFLIKIVLWDQLYLSHFVITLIIELFIIIMSPIDSKERALSEKENRVFKRIAIIISTTVFGIYVLLLSLGLQSTAIPIGTGIIITGCLQIPCCFRKRKYVE